MCSTPHCSNQHGAGCPASIISGRTLRDTPLVGVYRLSELSRRAGGRGRAGAICLLPVGSLEQHGEHLPVGTDTLLVETVCLRAAELAHRDVDRRSHRVDRVQPTPCPARRHRDARARAPARARALGRRRPAGLVPAGRDRERARRQPWLAGGARARRGLFAVNYWELVAPALLRELFPADLGSIGHAGQAETSAMLAALPALVGTTGAAFEPIAARRRSVPPARHGREWRAWRPFHRFGRRRGAVPSRRLPRYWPSCSTHLHTPDDEEQRR